MCHMSQNVQGTCDFLLVRPYQCFATNREHKPIGRVMPMGRWSKAAGGARQTASLRQGSNILLPSWSGAGKQLLVFSVYHVKYIPFSRSVTKHRG